MLSTNATANDKSVELSQNNNSNDDFESIITTDKLDTFLSLSGDEDNVNDKALVLNNPSNLSSEGVHWLEHNVNVGSIGKQVLLFDDNDIFTNKPPKSHISKLVKKKFGSRTLKITDDKYCDEIYQRHEVIRVNFLNNVRTSVEDLMTNIAMKIGMRDGKARYTFIDIARHTLNQPTWESICRLNFVLRGAFEHHHNWKIKFEGNFMKKLKFQYINGFKSQGKQHGCFVRIIADVISNKIRDVNARLKKHLGISLTIRNFNSRVENSKRMIPNNKSFFGIKKNVKIHLDSDAYKKHSSKTINKIDYTFPPPTSLFHHVNHNGEIEYSILEGIIFPPKSLFMVNQAIMYWIADMPTNQVTEIPRISNSIISNQFDGTDTDATIQGDKIPKLVQKEVIKYNVEKQKDEESEILAKRQQIRRMVGKNIEKMVKFNLSFLWEYFNIRFMLISNETLCLFLFISIRRIDE